MDLLRRLGGHFTLTSQHRGQQYFLRGDIDIVSSSATTIVAHAFGTSRYTLTATLEPRTLTLSCTCPHFLDGSPCKHLWGLALAIGSDEGLKGWRDVGSRRVVFDHPDGADFGDEDIDAGDLSADDVELALEDADQSDAEDEFDEEDDDLDTPDAAMRRGQRRVLSAAQRREITERMRRYWAERRRKKEEEEPRADGPRPRRGMSAAQRKQIAERMRRYWAERRRKKEEEEPTADGPRPRRGMSAAMRKQVSERMSRYWAERRKVLSGRDEQNENERKKATALSERMRAPWAERQRAKEERDGKRVERPSPPPAPWRPALQRVREAAELPAITPSGPALEIFYVVDETSSTVPGGSLALDLCCTERKANGAWGRLKPLRLTHGQLAALDGHADRRILSLLTGSAARSGSYAYDYSTTLPLQASISLPRDLASTVLPEMSATGRLTLRHRDGSIVPLCWDEGAAWTFVVTMQQEVRTSGSPESAAGDPVAETGDADYVVTGVLARGGVRARVSVPRFVTAWFVAFGSIDGVEPALLARLDAANGWPWIQELRQSPEMHIRADQVDAFLAELCSLPGLPRLELPPELEVDDRETKPMARLMLKRARQSSTTVLGALSFDYEGAIVTDRMRSAAICRVAARTPAAAPSEDPPDEASGNAEPSEVERRTSILRRDLAFERDAAEQLRRLGFRDSWQYGSDRDWLEIDAMRIPIVVRDLLAAGWRVEADGRLYRPFTAWTCTVRSGIDWFELRGDATFGDQVVALPHLLAALRRETPIVTLGDGGMGVLPEAWLQRHVGILAFGGASGDHLRFKRSQVLLLDALLAEQDAASIDLDDAFQQARDELQRFESVAPADPPPTFAGTLRGYQREGLGWLLFLRRFGLGGCLADDMGLGKTVMVLALLETLRAGASNGASAPSLVVAPRSVLFNWLREAARFTPALRVADYSGPDRASHLDRLSEIDLLVTTYGTLRRDAARLRDIAFDHVILDEAQAIKNAATASAKAARLLKGRDRLALSGTPVENHVGELFSLFEFLNPGMLGRPGRALDTADVRVTRSGVGGRPATPEVGGQTSDDEQTNVARALARALRPFILRRTKQQVAADLPPRQEETIWCELEPPQRRLYDELRAHYRASVLGRLGQIGLAKSKLHVLEALLRLRQAACHPSLLDRGAGHHASAKFDALIPQIEQIVEEGHKALVFSQFTSLLALLERELDRRRVCYEYLDGKTRDREARVARFQRDEACSLFLVSLRAGGLGLNLTAADYVFLLDPWWNPAVEAQAIDRTHRIGQTRPVFAYRLIARDTVEERIVELQRCKRALADAIITEDNSLIRTLTREDLEMLLT